MATQGIVSVKKGGKVVMKFIAGSDGYNAEKLAKAIGRKKRVPKTLKAAYQMAVDCDFGSKQDLVVMDESNIEYHGEDEVSDRYRKTFNQPEFNPRWEQGIADHAEVVEL